MSGIGKLDIYEQIAQRVIALICSVPNHSGSRARTTMVDRDILDELNGLLIVAGFDMREERYKARLKKAEKNL